MAAHTGSTVNPFLFNAQQFDQASGDYFLRARYYDQSNGRFISQDPFGGRNGDPVSLHKYLYAGDDPTDMVDPGGQDETLAGTLTSSFVNATLTASIAGGLTNVVVDASTSLLFGENYGFVDGLQSFALGFITEGATALLGKGFQLIKLASRSKAAPLLVYGVEKYSKEIAEDGARHWATDIVELKNKWDIFKIGGDIRLKWANKIVAEIKDLSQYVGVPQEELERYMPAFSPNLWSWWKGALGQYSYQAWGATRAKLALAEGFATIIGLRSMKAVLDAKGYHSWGDPVSAHLDRDADKNE